MDETQDPFVHHPVLRDRIKDPFQSFFRNFKPSDFDARMKEQGASTDWRFTDAQIEASRAAFIGPKAGADLWVFAYGSLMWDPAIRFAEVRRARIHGFSRSFCLKDTFGARGTAEAPGLMAALDTGGQCDGLAFRIAADHVEEESGVLWRRELVGPAYLPLLHEIETAHGPVEALIFAADHSAPVICADIGREDQIRYIATGAGFLGSSLQYLENIVAQFGALGIEDRAVSQLLEDTIAYRAGLAETA